MRDSNPRGLAPNPLSKSALIRFKRFPDGHLSLRGRFLDISGRPRTPTTETKTETMAPSGPPGCKASDLGSLGVSDAQVRPLRVGKRSGSSLLLLQSDAAHGA